MPAKVVVLAVATIFVQPHNFYEVVTEIREVDLIDHIES